jgi:hypothetical protein
MRNSILALVSAVLVATVGISTVQPAKADSAATTRAIILGAAALVAGVAVSANVAHKRQVANTVVGYLQDGSTVYQDGHVVSPNGQSYYPSQYGQTVACSNQTCYLSGGNGSGPYYGYNGNNPYGNNQYGNNGQPPFGFSGQGPYYANGNANGNQGNACPNNGNNNGYNNGYNNNYNNGYNNGYGSQSAYRAPRHRVANR